MVVSENFMEYVLDQLSLLDGISTRKMFGGVAIYRYKKIFALVSDDTVYMKVDETTKAKYIDAGSTPLVPFPNRPIIKSYYELPVDILENVDELVEWVEESLLL